MAGGPAEFTEGNRHSGLVRAHFEIPDCRRITDTGYGKLDVHVRRPGEGIKAAQEVIKTETGEEWWNDAHFDIFAIRIGVRAQG